MRLLWYLVLFTNMACQSGTEKPHNEKADHKPAVENKSKAYALKKNEGEVLNDARGRTTIVKVSPETGAVHLTMGTQQMPKGSGITVHRHDQTEEILFVHRGSGIAVVDGDTINIDEGSTLFIPPGTWHGVENPNDSMSILFVVTPQGLEKLFRRAGSPPGAPLKKLTEQQRDSIGEISDSRVRKTQ